MNVNPYKAHCEKRKATGQYRELSTKHTTSPKDYLDFSSNDYLDLSKNPKALLAAYAAAKQFGVGSTGSRLLSGNGPLFSALEAQISEDKNTEAALIFNSGYQANISVLAALCQKKIFGKTPLVFFDKANHASLYAGIQLSGATLIRYPHLNMDRLAILLEQYRNDPRPKWIVTETLYGMDGDVVPLGPIINLAKHYKAFLYLDEAHATGILGPLGYGLSTALHFGEVPHIIMGTFSKAVGVCGAYIACSQIIKNYLLNYCTGFIYSTALSPLVIGAIRENWNHIKTLSKARQTLLHTANDLRERLQNLGFNTGTSTTHIIPLIFNSLEDMMCTHTYLRAHHIQVSAVRAPTVPPNSPRLRIALSLAHQKTDIERVIRILKGTIVAGHPSNR